MRRFDYAAPTSVAEACSLLASNPGARPLAGGTDLIIQMKERGRVVPLVVSLRDVAQLQDLSTNGSITIGSMVRCGEIAWSSEVKAGWAILTDGADLVGSVQIRNKATVGGNICNAAPSADVIPALIALDATATIAGASGIRSVALADFFKGQVKPISPRAKCL